MKRGGGGVSVLSVILGGGGGGGARNGGDVTHDPHPLACDPQSGSHARGCGGILP